MKTITCCFKCENRHVGCHSECKSYAEEKKEYEESKDDFKQMRQDLSQRIMSARSVNRYAYDKGFVYSNKGRK